MDRTFFALSDRTRRDIPERLARGPATISELAEPFGEYQRSWKSRLDRFGDYVETRSSDRG